MHPDRSARFVSRELRELRRESLIEPLAELGLVAADGPNDPEPSLVIEGGRVVELDGRRERDWDALDAFVARYGLDLEVAAETASLGDSEIARLLVDVDAPRSELVRLSRGLTPARLARVIALLDPVELMFALKKLRARRTPANQAHVTNLKENPALLAADAAEAAARGFAEIETTVGVSRYAPLNAIAILVGSQTGRPGVMTQCAVEERLNLRLAILGLVTYAETLSVYGTEAVFVDGDDTPWSKAFLASAYASRGIKVRFTSGGGSEALMGESEGKSMLYLEARCLSLVRAAGSQGVQNGSISCVALALSVPGGTRAVLAENVLAAWLDLEVASGNDAIASHSEIRKTAKLMGQFLPGTDFVTSGYSAMPRYDNMFGGGNYDSDDLDEWLTMQRDWQVDAGIEPLDEETALTVRARAARAIQAVFAAFGFPPISDQEVALATTCLDSRDLPDRDRAADVSAADRVLSEQISGLEVAREPPQERLPRGRGRGLRHAAPAGRRRLSPDLGDHRSRRDGHFRSQRRQLLLGAGHRLPPGRRALAATAAATPRSRRAPARRRRRRDRAGRGGRSGSRERQARRCRDRGRAGVRGALLETIGGLSHRDVLEALVEGVREEGASPRLVRVRRSADIAFIGHDGAFLAGSGIAVGVQSKGTALIHRADLEPLDCLELFGMAPSLTLESYRQIGRNAAGYALGRAVAPVPTMLDNYARAKLIVRTTMLHARETAEVVDGAAPVELALISATTPVG